MIGRADLGIYLDHNATTPLDERVLDAMEPFLRGGFGNAASTQHAYGRFAADAVERARAEVAELVGSSRLEISLAGHTRFSSVVAATSHKRLIS